MKRSQRARSGVNDGQYASGGWALIRVGRYVSFKECLPFGARYKNDVRELIMLFSAEQVIEALYRATFNRAPDKGGFATHVARLDSDPSTLLSIAQDMFNCEEHKILSESSTGLADHSQFREFPLLLRHLVSDGSIEKLIIDVGARGKDRSNSFDLLSQFGWKGVLIEANPKLYHEIASDFHGTDFTLVECAVGPSEGVMPFYIGSNDDVSSLLKDAAVSWGELRGQVEVEVQRLPKILQRLKIPQSFDVLSLDIEGVDVSVLNDLIDSSHYRPKYIIIEASYNFQTKQLSDVGCSTNVQASYEIVAHTEANLILKLR